MLDQTGRNPVLQIIDLAKRFGETTALDGVTFDLYQGEIAAVLGPSGCGKSTLLHLIAGLEHPDRGSLAWEGRDLAGVLTHQRGFGLMFQEFALFPHLNVAGNVGFGLKMQGLPAQEIRTRVSDALRLVSLEGYEARQVDTLSGGERQRVALARSLAPRPRLLMLDEPLGALDRTLRERLLLDLPIILAELGQTALYVTHDQEEAFAIADRVVLMNTGRVEQIGTPLELYRSPRSAFAASFLGLTNLFPARIFEKDGIVQVETPFGAFPLRSELRGEATVLLRGDRVHLDGRGSVHIGGRVLERSFRGRAVHLMLESRGRRLTCTLDSDETAPDVGEKIELSFDPGQAIQVFA